MVSNIHFFRFPRIFASFHFRCSLKIYDEISYRCFFNIPSMFFFSNFSSNNVLIITIFFLFLSTNHCNGGFYGKILPPSLSYSLRNSTFSFLLFPSHVLSITFANSTSNSLQISDSNSISPQISLLKIKLITY